VKESTLAQNKYPLSGKIEYNYNYNPRTSIIINYFTSLETMIKSINNFRYLGADVELIINNDKAKDSDKIMSILSHRNDRLITCNDLGEKRGYHNGACISNASDFLIFTQDDDLAPDNNEWYNECLAEFEKDDKLGMIGLLKGGINYCSENSSTIYKTAYCSWLATGPLMIRRDVYNMIGGWSEEYSQIGESDGVADADMATKVWLKGYKSLLLKTPAVNQWKRRFERGDGWGKKEIGECVNRKERIKLNRNIYRKKFKDLQADINSRITGAEDILQ